MPGALLPDDPATPAPADWYSPAELDVFRLSSKSHWDLPILIGRQGRALPDEPSDAAGLRRRRRTGTARGTSTRSASGPTTSRPARGGYIYDDAGRSGGLEPGIAVRDRRRPELRPARRRQHPGRDPATARAPARQHDSSTPASPGAVEQNALQGGVNLTHRSDPKLRHRRLRRRRTAATCGPTTCCRGRTCTSSTRGVFWPLMADPLFRLVGVFPFPTSDHRLVWVDVRLPAQLGRAL